MGENPCADNNLVCISVWLFRHVSVTSCTDRRDGDADPDADDDGYCCAGDADA